MVIFLDEDLNQDQLSSTAHKGKLRLYTKGESVDGIVDISPRIGRAVLFKSEEMMHQVISSSQQDTYTLTFYFNQVVNKPPKPHPIPEDWKIFISIAAYRDL